MKNIIRLLSIIGILSIPQLAYSDSITDTFTTGDTLTATTLNNIKSAVNGNDTNITAQNSRISALEAAPKANVTSTAPTTLDDINAGYPDGSVWIDMAQNQAYILVDSAAGAAVWKPITPKNYSIGDTGPAGGFVFYVTGDGAHGLEAAAADQADANWGCSGTGIPGAGGTVIGTGARNTDDIIRGCSNVGIAAALADDYTSSSGYIDWYLPSIGELNSMYFNIGPGNVTLGNVGSFASDIYWSSSEFANLQALAKSFASSAAGNEGKGITHKVRAIRAF